MFLKQGMGFGMSFLNANFQSIDIAWILFMVACLLKLLMPIQCLAMCSTI